MKRLATAFLLLIAATPVFGQPREPKLRVATRIIKPFVFEENRALTGFSIELWQEISRQLNAQSEFIMEPSVMELLEATRSKKVDLAIAAISITAEREIDWDFSQPMFDAGLQIQACWWAASTLATQADQMPRAALARIVAVIWMFASVVFIAYFTAAVTSSLTLQQLRGDISGPEDLPGKRVASVRGSTSMDYLRSARPGGCRRLRRAGLALLCIA